MVHEDLRDGIYSVTLDRQQALNALTFGMLGEIGAAFDRAGASGARALIVTGAGPKAFCAGADIPELQGRNLQEQKAGAELGQRVFAKLDDLPFPSIAAINGYAFGGGLELAMACTFRIASPKARMGLPEIKLGLIPGYGGTQRLPRLVGEARALEMILTGRTMDAETAEKIGLVSRVAEDSVAAAVELAAELAKFSLPVLGFAAAAIRRASQLPLHEGLKAEAELSTLAYRTADAEEGMAAFVEKRQPRFRDA
jgi:enoyl-CoA hydratase